MISPSAIRAWAGRQAGRQLHEKHVLAILELLAATDTTLAAWRLQVATYPGWREAIGRTKEERQAAHVGESYRPGKSGRRVLFMVPIVAAEEDSVPPQP